MSPRDESPTTGEMFAELFDLLTGLGILVLPLFIFAIPGLVLLLPLALLALPAAVLALPYLLIRALRRRGRATVGSPRGFASSAQRSKPPSGRGAARIAEPTALRQQRRRLVG